MASTRISVNRGLTLTKENVRSTRVHAFERRQASHLNRHRTFAPAVSCSAERKPRGPNSTDEKDALVNANVMNTAAALLGAALLFTATPDEALAARSGGRVGGSSGFSSRPRSAPSMPRSGPSIRNYNYYSAPPLVSPYGFGVPFFGGGIVTPFPFFGIGTIFNIVILMFVLNVVLNVIRNFTNKGNDDTWDDDERW